MLPRQLFIFLTICTIALIACNQEDASVGDSLQQVKDAAGDVASSADKLVGAVENLSKDKIEDLAKIAAKLESAPDEAARMLEEHGLTREEFDKMVSQIKKNDELNKIFESAKNMAMGS